MRPKKQQWLGVGCVHVIPYLVQLSAPQTPIPIRMMKEDSGWWLNQPIWKICSSNWIISPGRGENKKYLSCHHLEILDYLLLSKTGHGLVSTWNPAMCWNLWGVEPLDSFKKLFPFQTIQMGQKRNSMHNCLHLDIALCNNIQYTFSAGCWYGVEFSPPPKQDFWDFPRFYYKWGVMFLSHPKESTKLERGNFGRWFPIVPIPGYPS